MFGLIQINHESRSGCNAVLCDLFRCFQAQQGVQEDSIFLDFLLIKQQKMPQNILLSKNTRKD